MDELIDIVTKTGEPTGKTAPKSEIHSKGFYHNTAHLWLYTSKGDILLAQRSFNKAICPGLWDVSVAGHIDANETIEDGIIREAKEEIGLELSKENLQKIGVFPCFQTYPNGMIDNEFHHTFIAQLHVDLSKLTLQKEEVERVKLVSISQFKDLLENSTSNNHFVASNANYYSKILEAIIKKTI